MDPGAEGDPLAALGLVGAEVVFPGAAAAGNPVDPAARVLDPRELFKQAAEVKQTPVVGLDTDISPLSPFPIKAFNSLTKVSPFQNLWNGESNAPPMIVTRCHRWII